MEGEEMALGSKELALYQSLLELSREPMLLFSLQKGGRFRSLWWLNGAARERFGESEISKRHGAALFETLVGKRYEKGNASKEGVRIEEILLGSEHYLAIFLAPWALGGEEEEHRRLLEQNKMAKMGEMIGAIAHQWRQPLSSIKLLAQDLLEAYRFNELTLEYLTGIKSDVSRHVDYLAETIEDFRNFYKADREKKPLELGRTIKEAIKIAEAQIQLSLIKVKLEIPSEEVWVMGYLNELKQVFLSLLSNSRDALLAKAGQEGAFEMEIKISLEMDLAGARVIFWDNGEGVKEGDEERIFERFYSSRSEQGGTGIGLYLARKILQKSFDASISLAHSRHPTIFELFFPLRS